jgi:CBS domain-containing protein
MHAADVMTHDVISVGPDTSIKEAARCMLRHRISGLPVLDGKGRLVGMITEGDLLRREEVGTERHRPRWLELFVDPGKRADEYVHAFGRKVEEVMAKDVQTVTETTPLAEVVDLMERCRIKRVPVMRGGELVGIVTRANLLPAVAWLEREVPSIQPEDDAIRASLVAELGRQTWVPPLDKLCIEVRDGVVELRGAIYDTGQRTAIRVAAENAPGVKAVKELFIGSHQSA